MLHFSLINVFLSVKKVQQFIKMKFGRREVHTYTNAPNKLDLQGTCNFVLSMTEIYDVLTPFLSLKPARRAL